MSKKIYEGENGAHVPYDPYYPDRNVAKQRRPERYPVSVGAWIWTFIITCIPVINFIMFWVWSFSSNTHPSKKTYARAWLIISLIIIVLTAVALIVLSVVFGYEPDDFKALIKMN